MKTLKKLMLLATLALAPTVMFAADHIVFIHGWNGDKDTWERMVKFMTNPEYGTPFVEASNVLVVEHSHLSSHIDEVAKNVRDQIVAWLDGFPDGKCPSKIDFVVHSMGGLIIRSMIDQNLMSESIIDHVVTLATPHYGQSWNKSVQQRDMEYGSEFIWKLANTANKITPSKMLCVVGTQDGLVAEWSAALQDKECASVRYVKKDHTASGDIRVGGPGIIGNNGICYCSNGRNDVVYKLVTDFLSSGAITAGDSIGSKNAGAVLFQIVDGKGMPVPYEQMKVASEEDAFIAGMTSFAMLKKPSGGRVYAHVPSASYPLGIGSLYDISPGSYQLDVQGSKDKIFSAFTYDSIPVVRGRTTVIPIPAENVRPLDYVFLIDTTGSMGSHINSVKANAKNLVQTKLLNGARDCRVAVVDYRDFPDRTGDSNDYPYNVKCQFTSDASTAISAINSLSLGYGGDGPETVYSGIHACIEGNGAKIGGWRANAIKTIMVLGDARPLDPEPKTGYTAADVKRWANTLKVDGDDTESGIIGLGSGISIYPVLTSSSSSLRDAFSGIAEETGGKVVSSSDYSSVADAVEEVIVQSVSANGFETEIVTARETDGKVTVRIFGGNETEPASIGYQIVSGSAESGKDFTGTDGIQRLTWLAGERSYKEIVVPVAEDSTTSNDKFFSIVLCDPVGMGLGGINVCRINLLDRDSDGEFRVGDIYVQGLSRRSDMGSVNGSGYCAAGSAVALSATAKSGYVFTSWENGSTISRRNITAQMASSNAVDGVATYVASFIPLADLPVPTIESSGVVTGIVGQAVSWNLNYYSMSEATVKCEGLPSGLSFADGAISGTPDRRGISTVTFTVQNAKGSSSAAVSFVFVRDPSAPYLSMSGEEGEFDASSASTYNGYVVGFDGLPIGTLLVKAAKANARTGKSKITAKLQLSNGKKISFRGETDNGQVSMTAADQVLTITLGKAGMTGSYGDYDIDGARNFFTSKDKSEANAANDVIAQWIGAVNVVWDGGVASVSIAKKGKVKASVTLANGTKATANAQLLVGDEWLCVPVVVAKKVNIAFTLWLPRDGGAVVVEGLPDGAVAGKAGALKSGAAFKFDASALASALGDATYAAQLPDGLSVEQDGKKWIVAGGAKAGKVQLAKGAASPADIDEAKAGANPSALKLTYKAKDGTFKGTFKAYTLVKGKPKATTLNVSGILVGDKGYGTLSVKKTSVSAPVEIR